MMNIQKNLNEPSVDEDFADFSDTDEQVIGNIKEREIV